MARRIRLLLEYDGTAYHGWQSQKDGSAIQDVIESKLKVLLKEDGRIQGASRTDSGVHARGQVAAFNTESDKAPEKILAGLNGLLPRDIRVRDCQETVAVFDPRRDAAAKTYRYVFMDGPSHSPFWRRYSWYVKGSLDEGRMAQAAKSLVGEHDFSSFRAAGCAAKTPVRRILAATVTRKGERVTLEIKGQAFLQQMVRIIAGVLHDIGTGKQDPSFVSQLLKIKDRKKASKTAPANGLVLWNIDYGAIPRPGRRVLGQLVPEGPEED
jgi:tRNA pseudouridine38-40 synthase